MEPGLSGLVWPLFDVEALSEQVLAVLRDPATFAPLGRGARAMIEDRYSLDACVPRLRDYFERVASRP
jgi:glycosyltransferase involved in cell wall biosynthesis